MHARGHLREMAIVRRAGLWGVWTVVIMTMAVAEPAWAQIDFSGEWAMLTHEDQPHRLPGPALGEYQGTPLNDAARRKADSWDASLLTLPEHQTMPHPSTYGFRGPSNMRIQKIVDPRTQQVAAFTMFGTFGHEQRVIWLDGRPHPPEHAPHTWQGFSTGYWEGDMLTIYTTHVKTGWIHRNGVASSDQTTMWEHWIRNDEILTLVNILYDPVYLTEPFIRTTNWRLAPGQQLGPRRFDPIDEVAGHPKGYVPHYLPGRNPYIREFAERYGIPFEATRGYAESMYPEYQIKLKQMMEAGSGQNQPGGSAP
ncbi:MAG: hypothetical protein HY657_03590 [Acidobacteria bacterium]|nr:hypothetical protein [Acidobacteriota bacterium]